MNNLTQDNILSPRAYDVFFSHREAAYLSSISQQLRERIRANLDPSRNNQLELWKSAIASLPECAQSEPLVENGRVSVGDTQQPTAQVEEHLRALMPWRKGPYRFFDCIVDTEWQSDWKWNRVLPNIDSLEGRRVLDVGCGNGYHLWRMREAGAQSALGLEPHLLNVAQFALMQRWFPHLPVSVLPLALEEYPTNTRIYDTVFSMGVLYHRKAPAEHLLHLKSCLRQGGQLVLETLVVPGDEHTVLVPEDRYGKMPNVWYIPSADHCQRLLRRVGFQNIRLVDENSTSTAEQRSTSWMQFESLSDFLDPKDPARTIEGYPAPCRALFTATAP